MSINWILEHWQLVATVAGAIAVWINQRRREKQGQPADYDEDGVPDSSSGQRSSNPGGVDADEAERTRRIQEEIRRKILERMAGGRVAPPPLVAGSGPVEMTAPPVASRRVVPPPLPFPSEEEVVAVQERQRRLAERMSALEAQRAEVRRAAEVVSKAGADAPYSTPVREVEREIDWVKELRSAGGARRALVMREILGPPVGLK